MADSSPLGPLHTRDWEPVTITLQALSLVEMAEPVQLCFFTLRLSDQQSMWIQDGWMESLHGFLHGVEWIMSHGHLDHSPKPPLGGQSNTKPGDHRTHTQTLTTVGLFFLYHVWGPAWIEIHWISIWLRAQSHVTSHYTWGSVTITTWF